VHHRDGLEKTTFVELPRCELHGLRVQRGPSEPSAKGTSDGPTPAYPLAGPPGRGTDRALFCLIDDAYATLNPHGARRYESIKRLSDSEVIALALFQQLRGVERGRTFVLAGCRAVLLSPLSGGSKTTPPFLLQPAAEEAQALRMEPLRRGILPELS
jgi:hypothetical protein